MVSSELGDTMEFGMYHKSEDSVRTVWYLVTQNTEQMECRVDRVDRSIAAFGMIGTLSSFDCGNLR